ncbi:cilia- and flagella-associated protein 61 [Protopterus annectens]|uniref:cilia- and flagella-associated protein 61 n=1 Tax=Protopterus annectens TaxID=7888 RepID=UPI001CFBE6C2|nr:cilia- and flagella-associated protein 61 [Protopterus annectens]
MAKKFSSKLENEIINVRRSESLDANQITDLIRASTEGIFGRVNVIYLLEKANLALTVCTEKNVVVAHAAFLDYPALDFVDQASWESWLHENYDSSKCTPLNTLFMHLFVAITDVAVRSIKELIRTVFTAAPELHFILLFTLQGIDLEPALEEVFKPLKCLKSSKATYAAFVCHRHDHCPVLYVRRARVRDHDDLIPIFTRQDETLINTYGEYFLAELIDAQDEENHAVVCEVGGTAVGFMSLSSDVNTEFLNECFELVPFHGLHKPHPDDLLAQPVVKSPSEPSPAPEREINSPSSQRPESSSSQHSAESSTQSTESKEFAKDKQSTNPALENKVVASRPTSTGSDTSQGDISPKINDPESFAGEIKCQNLKHTSSTSRESGKRDNFHPVYKGDLNAFCIQLFGIDEKYETRSMDFLPYAFQLYPEKDFCIITVPRLVPEFPLLQTFVRVGPRSCSTLSQELYVFHRSGLLQSFVVRPAKSSDMVGAEKLVRTLALQDSILKDLQTYNQARRDADGTAVQALVAEVMSQIVGIAIVRNEEEIEYIRSHYNIEDFVYFNHHQREEHGHLHHFVLNPVFQHYIKHFFKEILRLTYKSCLYYPVYPSKEEMKSPCAHSLTSALHYMVPVRPRRQIAYPLKELGINAPSRRVCEDQVSYALNHTNRKLTLEPKVTINAQIVVVGASDVGISFLETLVFCPHLRFNNITLVSTHGLLGNKAPSPQHQAFLAKSHCYNDKDYALMSLQSWVNVVVGKMTGINRAAKYIVISGGQKVPYDHLILCCGQQYQVPCPSGADIGKLVNNRELSVTPDQRFTKEKPCNLFTLNDDEDCQHALHWLQDNFINLQGNAIIYGNTTDVYTTAQTLLSLGISGSRIHVIEPPLNSIVTCFNNFIIESGVQDALAKAGVTLYHNSILAQWNNGGDTNSITCASFTTDTKPFKLQCLVFFSFYPKKVDYEAFKAINDACLVFDGCLVIDKNFHTNDAAIRAAGPLTKFARRYYVDELSHSNFNSKEIGFQLAAAMLQLFDPTIESVAELPEKLDHLIVMYTAPKVQGGFLPGEHYYLHVAKPGISAPLEIQKAQLHYGEEFITGSVKDGNYFRIHLNRYSMVETITCVSKQPFPVSNYLCLYGQHERLLNGLCARFAENLISDLYSYFKEPWCMAIYHDRFIDFKQEVRQILASKQVFDVPTIEQMVYKLVSDGLSLSEDPQEYLQKQYEECGYKNLVERSVLNYLKYNSYHLPMYAQPGMI